MDPRRAAPGNRCQRDEFEIGARRRENDSDVRIKRIGRSNPLAQCAEMRRVGRQARRAQGKQMISGGHRNIVRGRRRKGQRAARVRRCKITVKPGLRIQRDARITARRQQVHQSCNTRLAMIIGMKIGKLCDHKVLLERLSLVETP